MAAVSYMSPEFGRAVDSVVKSFRTQMPVPFEIAAGEVRMDSIIVTIDSSTKLAESIERLSIRQDYKDTATYDTDDGKPEYLNDNF